MFGNNALELWSESARPSTIDDYIFQNETMKEKINEMINTGNLVNCLFHGPAGTGKTSLINVICSELIERGTVTKDDIREWNCSEATSIDVVREQIMNEAQTSPFGSFKILILEEFQQMSKQAQGSLKRIIEESSARGSVRFMLTTNEIDKVDNAIISRCKTGMFEIKSHDKEQFVTHGVTILLNNNILIESEEDFQIVMNYADICYPDMRSFIGTLQQNCIGNKLKAATDIKTTFEEEIITHVATGTILNARETILQNIDQTQYIELYRWLYRNVDIFLGQGSPHPDDILRALIIIEIRDSLVRDNLVADREINLTSCLCKIWMIATGTL